MVVVFFQCRQHSRSQKKCNDFKRLLLRILPLGNMYLCEVENTRTPYVQIELFASPLDAPKRLLPFVVAPWGRELVELIAIRIGLGLEITIESI